ncbi:hypothetical protein EIZ39_22575 [Ammoniphilus sp. CFH 90114]|nr:hypothetical protein EIZ39_22575 [Ammoniphilus sp. CFH 90114]
MSPRGSNAGIVGEHSVFEPGEQAYFRSRGFVPPKRCPDCREKKWMEESS